MGIGLLYFLIHFKKIGSKFLTHPITLLIYLHLFWTFFTSLTSYSI
jgi:hypothetical protein